MKHLCLFILFGTIFSIYPVAIFHGIGDGCNNQGMHNIAKFISDNLDGVYSKCIESGGGIDSFDTSFKAQAERACQEIQSDPNFQGDFSIMGISQGSLIGRYILQACPIKGVVKRYISIGGPQMGVGAFPHCESGPLCWALERIIDFGVYNSFVQNNIGPAGYFKAVGDYQNYLQYSSFLADLNNEKQDKNKDYFAKVTMLEKMLLIKFSTDTMIIPKETAWFQFYDSNHNVVNLEDSEFYKNDYLGIRTLNEGKRIQFVELPGQHLHFNRDDIITHMIPALK
jgi:palmitoyl-protein thioesterase